MKYATEAYPKEMFIPDQTWSAKPVWYIPQPGAGDIIVDLHLQAFVVQHSDGNYYSFWNKDELPLGSLTHLHFVLLGKYMTGYNHTSATLAWVHAKQIRQQQMLFDPAMLDKYMTDLLTQPFVPEYNHNKEAQSKKQEEDKEKAAQAKKANRVPRWPLAEFKASAPSCLQLYASSIQLYPGPQASAALHQADAAAAAAIISSSSSNSSNLKYCPDWSVSNRFSERCIGVRMQQQREA